MKKLFALMIALLACQQALALTDGHRFAEMSRSFSLWEADPVGNDREMHSAMFFMGYVAAVSDLQVVLGRVCYKDQPVTRGQVAAIVAKYIRENPQDWSSPALPTAGKAIVQAFPCN